MNELGKPVGRVWRRMRFQRFLTALVWGLCGWLTVAAVALAVAKAAHRDLPGPEWMPFVAAFGLAAVTAGLIAVWRGPSRLDAALAIDRTFRLNERLSTALTLPGDVLDTAAGQALVRDALKRVDALDVQSACGLRLPRRSWLTLVPAALAVAVVVLPEIDVRRAQAKLSAERKVDPKLVTAETRALGKKIASQRKDLEKTKFPEADKLLAQIEKAADDLAKAPPAQKDKALVALNKLSDALKDRQAQLGSPEQINRQLQQLKNAASSGPADKFVKDLARGDFQKAADEVKKLADQLRAGKMTDADKQALKEQIGAMSKQLEKLANLDQRKQQLEEARKNGGLSQEQYEQEMAKLEQQAKGLQKLGQMANKLAEAQDALNKGDTKKAAETLGMTEQQLSEMAKNVQELASLDQAMAEVQDAKDGMTGDGLSQLGEGMDGMGMGNRMNRNGAQGLGRGRGMGDRPEAPDATSTYSTKVKQQLGKGKAFAAGTAPSNTPVKGQSVIGIQAEIDAAEGNAASALTNQKVPRNVERHIRGYFDQINKGK